jgi:D-alanyl-lipoteichoic acid acyltransferase DltB (MBOAT superfamily)
MSEREEKSKSKCMKRIVALGIILDIGMLGFLKYTNFLIENINIVTNRHLSMLSLILPLGISYYTFQTVGYLLDVYWGREEAEENLLKYALFVSFFPQLVQGPIGRYGRLAGQLTAERRLELHRIKYGLKRVIWGLFKKMIIAEWASVFREAIFAQPEQYSGIAIFGVLLYTIELYGDFAGGIDVVIGIAAMFGITLDENFRQPLFAVSISDFWRRWHITLGTWMKDYVFYPLTLSGGMRKLQKKAKAVWGRKKGRFVSVAISDLIVFVLVGLWHGPSWNNIGWGFYNGIIIATSGFLADTYQSWKTKLHINDKSKGYHLFMILRTFALFNIGQYFDCVNSVGEALQMVRYSLTSFHPSQFLQISSGKLGTAYTPYALLTLAIGCLIWFVVSVMKERGVDVEGRLAKMPLAAEFGIYLLLFISIPLFSPMSVARGFIYAQF